MRLIDAEGLMKAMYHRAFETDGDTMWQSGCWVRYRAIEQTVKEQPTIEPKKGRWITEHLVSTGGGTYPIDRCSECEYASVVGRSNYCPNCGARMDEAEE